jgi:hypothetical protein
LAAISNEGEISKFSVGASPPPHGQAKAQPVMLTMNKETRTRVIPIEAV